MPESDCSGVSPAQLQHVQGLWEKERKDRDRPIRQFLLRATEVARSSSSASLNGIRRAQNKYLSSEKGARYAGEQGYPQRVKADATDVDDMIRRHPEVFRSGETPVADGVLNTGKMWTLHQGCCKSCRGRSASASFIRAETRLSSGKSGCLYPMLHRVLTHGSSPLGDDQMPTPLPGKPTGTRNYPPADTHFAEAYEAEIGKMAVSQPHLGTVLLPCSWQPDSSSGGNVPPPGTIHPCSIVLKNSDRARAFMLTGKPIDDMRALRRANEVLLKDGQKKVKTRPTTDCSISGLNACLLPCPFFIPGRDEVAGMMEPNCWLGKIDISSYFFRIPLAYEARLHFRVWCNGKLWEYSRCCFGTATTPYLACTLSAEVGKWLRHIGAPCSYYVDDFTFVAPSLRDLDVLLDKSVALLNLVGLYCDPSKTEKGQELIILGLLHDSVRMQLRVDPTSALAAVLHLESLRGKLLDVMSGRRPAACLGSAQLASLTGKLNWFCEVLQSGRSRIRGFTKLLQYGADVPASDWRFLKEDLEWWIARCKAWAAGSSLHGANPFVDIRRWECERPQSRSGVSVFTSDASGVDDRGGFLHPLEDDSDPLFFSKRWGTPGVVYSSHFAEIMALHDLLHSGAVLPDGETLLWITDSLGAALSVNKGNCRAPWSYRLVRQIMTRADLRRIGIVALWVPRECNEAADYLSHLATELGRPEVSGRLLTGGQPDGDDHTTC